MLQTAEEGKRGEGIVQGREELWFSRRVTETTYLWEVNCIGWSSYLQGGRGWGGGGGVFGGGEEARSKNLTTYK